MASSNSIIKTRIIYSNEIQSTNEFNSQTKMNEIRRDVQVLFRNLPNSYSLKVYNPHEAEMIDLDQHQLDFGYNPFQLPSLTSHTNNEMVINDVILYVHKNRWQEFENNTPTSILCQDRAPSVIINGSTGLVEENQCQQASSLHCRDRDRPSDLSDSFKNFLESLNTDPISLATLPDHPDFDMVQFDEIQFDSNGSLDNSDETWQALSDTFHSSVQSFQNPLEQSPRTVSIGYSMPPENSSLILFGNSNGHQVPIQLNEEQNIELNRLEFSLDVKPNQKSIYKSDKFNQKNQNKKNGYITRIQGIKTGRPAKSSVLPRIRIPSKYRNLPNIKVLVYVVFERSLSGSRFGFKHHDKGFLKKNYTRNTKPRNPISFRVNGKKLTEDGDFKLPLSMTTMWDKSESLEEKVYELDEQDVINLHPARFESSVPRLCCVLRQGSIILWDTMCLSDYIRPTRIRRRDVSNTNITNNISNQFNYEIHSLFY